MSDWTPERVRERLGELGLSPDATDDELSEVIDDVIEHVQTTTPEPGPINDRSPGHVFANEVLSTFEPLPELPPELVGKPCRCLDPDCTIPYGICHCGCGERTIPYTSTDSRAGRVKGQYGLSKQRHTLKHNGGGIAMPYLAAFRRENGYAATKGNKGSRQRAEKAAQAQTRSESQLAKYLVSEDEHLERLSKMYDVFAAHADPKTNIVGLSAFDAMLEAGSRHFGKRATRYGASLLFKDLVHMGCLKTRGPQFKQIIKHPRDVDAAVAQAVAVTTEPKPQPKKAPTPVIETHEQMLDNVTPKEMADAIASAMWTRYERALEEVGRLSEIIATMTEENARLHVLLGSTPVDAKEAARRILADAAH